MTADPRGLGELRAFIEGSMAPGASRVVSIVGGGGKTSSLFALARSFAASGFRVLATTTTRILDPDIGSEREGRLFAPVLVLQDPDSPESIERVFAAGPRVIIGSRREGPKLIGIGPQIVPRLAKLFDIVLVEADGSRTLPIKAPASHEPVIPQSSGVVIGVIGLDALGSPMDEGTVFRPDLFGPLVGCARGEAIAPIHLARLAASPLGLFKGCPPDARRVIFLNKADAASRELIESCVASLEAAMVADAVVVGALNPEGKGGAA
jgi:probable selenium-dependent hydroxylase accessory protein YqeC